MAPAEVDENSLEYTTTWVVVSSSILFISIIVEKFFHNAGQHFKKKRIKWWPLVRGSPKIKYELMLLGLVSLLLPVFQIVMRKICIPERFNILLPCKKPNSSSAIVNFNTSSFASSGTRGRRLLAVAYYTTDYCSKKGKVALLSIEAIHQLDVFVFMLATFHVVLRVLKVLYMIRQWKKLELYDVAIGNADEQQLRESNVLELILLKQCDKREETLLEILVQFPKEYSNSIELVSILQKSYTSLTVEEYIALRLNFIAARDPKYPGKDFQEYIIQILDKEFEKMIRISWHSWFLPVIYTLVNVAGWKAYLWMYFIQFTILLIIGLKLEFMILLLIKKVAENHTKNENASSENGAKGTVYEITNNDRWFRRPNFIGILIHIMLYLNSLELAFFFFMLIQYGFHSCIMGKVVFVVSSIVMGGCLQIVCMSRILPLYAIMTSQMHLEQQQQLDKHNKTRKIKIYLEDYLSNEHVKKCLDDLDEIKTRLKKKQMDEEEEMQILTWISELIDNRKNRREEPNPPEESTNTELAGRSGAGDIEAQN